MRRRHFLGAGAAALAWSRMPAYAAELADQKKRVGLIGSGWYGKSDLFRLIQVAPVEVVSLCDVDKQMLAEAADLVAASGRSLEEAARAPTATTARCSRRRTSTSCSSARPTTGTPCR